MNKNTSKNLILQGSFLVASQMIVRAINLLYRIPVTNLWGDKGLGIYSDAYQVYSFFLIFASISIPTVISKMVSERLATGRDKDADRVLTCGLLLIGGIGFLSMLIMILGGHALAIILYDNPEATRPMQYLGPTVLVCSVMSVLRGYFQGMNDMKPTAISEVIEGFLHAVFSVALAFMLDPMGLEWSVTGGIIGTGIGAVGSLVFLLVCFYLVRKRIKADVTAAGVTAADVTAAGPAEAQPAATESAQAILRQMIHLMIPIVLSSTIFTVKSMIDSTLFGKLMQYQQHDPEAIIAMRGVYNGKFVVIVNLPVAVGEALGSASVPSIASARALGRRDEMVNHMETMIRTVLLITVPCAVGIALLGKPVLRLLFPTSFIGGELFWVGFGAVVFYSLSYVAGGVLNGLNRPELSMQHCAIGVVITSILNVVCILILHLGIFTFAVNTTIFSLFIMITNMKSAEQLCEVKIPFVKLAKGPIICSLLMGALCFVSYLFLFSIFGSNAIAAIGSIGIGVIAYFLLMVNLNFVTPEDEENIPGGRFLEYLRI